MAKHKIEKTKSKSNKKLIIILVTLILIAGGLLLAKMIQDGKTVDVQNNEIEEPEEPEIVTLQQIDIFNGDDRPFGVMIDNNTNAWPQAGLNDAYIVYEIIVEGGETRLFALFKGKDLSKIGPIRSARHYFLDYALENDAIFVHYGESPQAASDIASYKINSINGLVQSSSDFWRDSSKSQPHNAVTKTENLKKIAQKNGYRLLSDQRSVLNYVADPVELESEIIVNKLTLPISTAVKASYEYNPDTKRYTRYERGTKCVDWVTGEAVTTKNIIITFADTYTLQDTENKGRQGLNNLGSLDGYYITNGKAVPIICEKTGRFEKTIYKDLSRK